MHQLCAETVSSENLFQYLCKRVSKSQVTLESCCKWKTDFNLKHKPFAGPPMGMTVAMTGGVSGPGGGVHSKLVGQLGPYSSHGHSSGNMSGNMYTPLVNITGGKTSVASGQHSVASLQMV